MRSPHRMRSVWAWALMAVAALVLGPAAVASATGPVDLGSSRVLDQSGALSAAEADQVEARAEALTASSDIDLWVVYVDEFTAPESAELWADDTAVQNNLGTHQYLLAIATEGRAYYLWGDQDGPVSWDDLDDIEQSLIRPELGDLDWAGAAIAAADGLDSAAGGSGASGSTSDGSGGGIGIGVILFVVLLVVVIGVIVWLVIRSRRRSGGVTAGPAIVSTADLARQAASALVQTDDAIKSSEQELGFATAQFGEAAAAEFAAALTQAKTDLDQAFSLQQKLDDAEPDSEEQMRAWNTQILQLCVHAQEELQQKVAGFDDLRKLEQNAPEALSAAQAARAQVGSAAADAAATLTTLQQTYAPDALTAVADNPQQITQRLAFADEQLTAAQAAIGSGNGSAAAVSIRAAEGAVDQARSLQDAVTHLRDDLTAASGRAAAVVADLEKDLATAGALPDTDGRVAGVVAATRQQLATAQQDLTGSAQRPVAALALLEQTNTEIDAVLAGVRDEQDRQRRAAQQLDQLLLQAQSQVTAAEDFITSRRGAVGATARTRLAEAGATLVQARQVAASDPAQAAAAAQRSLDLSSQSLKLAQNDVGAFQGGGGGGGNMAGAVLGGLVLNSLLGGGNRSNRGGGFGGFGGGFGGGFSGGGSSSRSRSSSGGSRRSSPSRSSGGGRQTRRGGGRF